MSCEMVREVGGGARQANRPGLRLVTAAGSSLEDALAADLDASFERLVDSFQDRLFSFACRLAGNREDAEEIAQDAFVRAYRALKTRSVSGPCL